jgi:hypothetical protein
LEVDFLSGPIGIVRSIHNAFRRDVSQIDAAACKLARNGGDLTPVFERLHTVAEILDYHAQGEEAAVFPAVDDLTPSWRRLTFWIIASLTLWLTGWKRCEKRLILL